jgi:hypothetical protein
MHVWTGQLPHISTRLSANECFETCYCTNSPFGLHRRSGASEIEVGLHHIFYRCSGGFVTDFGTNAIAVGQLTDGVEDTSGRNRGREASSSTCPIFGGPYFDLLREA